MRELVTIYYFIIRHIILIIAMPGYGCVVSVRMTIPSLRDYLKWLSTDNPNVFAFLTDAEKKRLVSSWSDKYIEDENNDSKTMHMLISLLESPADDPDWKLACNYMKLIAVSLTTKKVFIKENYNAMIDSLIRQIVDVLC
nr:hypothetical protein [Lachnospiraceae bacterium]